MAETKSSSNCESDEEITSKKLTKTDIKSEIEKARRRDKQTNVDGGKQEEGRDTIEVQRAGAVGERWDWNLVAWADEGELRLVIPLSGSETLECSPLHRDGTNT